MAQFDDFKPNTLRSGIALGLRAGVAPVNERHFDRAATQRLHRFGQLSDLAPILFIGGGSIGSQQVTERIDGQMDFATRRFLAPS